MVSEGLRRLVRSAPLAGSLEGDDVRTGTAEHPVCGDVVELDLRLRAGRIVAARWRGSGCPASTAVAAAACTAWEGTEVTGAAARLRDHLTDLGGLAAHERHAERMVLRALEAAVEAPG